MTEPTPNTPAPPAPEAQRDPRTDPREGDVWITNDGWVMTVLTPTTFDYVSMNGHVFEDHDVFELDGRLTNPDDPYTYRYLGNMTREQAALLDTATT